MGNNIYSDLLSYKDWVKINNAQRCHENFTGHMPILFTTAFISGLSFPRFTLMMTFASFVVRVLYTNAYFSFRGYNRATADEELLKLFLVLLVGSSFVSSAKIMGLKTLFKRGVNKK